MTVRRNRNWKGQIVESGMKECTKCKRILPLEDFSQELRVSSGKSSSCTLCSNLWKFYKLTYAEYNAIYQAQGGLCAICRHHGRTGSKTERLDVDHDHKTGKIRGWLCNKCNRAIGFLLEDAAYLRRAIVYIEQHNGVAGPIWDETA